VSQRHGEEGVERDRRDDDAARRGRTEYADDAECGRGGTGYDQAEEQRAEQGGRTVEDPAEGQRPGGAEGGGE
jgi:hypothetical protein